MELKGAITMCDRSPVVVPLSVYVGFVKLIQSGDTLRDFSKSYARAVACEEVQLAYWLIENVKEYGNLANGIEADPAEVASHDLELCLPKIVFKNT